MNEQKKTKPASARSIRTSGLQENNPGTDGVSRRTFLGVGSASLATAALASLAVNAQEVRMIENSSEDREWVMPAVRKYCLIARTTAPPLVLIYGIVRDDLGDLGFPMNRIVRTTFQVKLEVSASPTFFLCEAAIFPR